MLFNNFVEGSLKLKIRFDVYITYSEKTKNKNEGIRIFTCKLLNRSKDLTEFFRSFFSNPSVQIHKFSNYI